MAYYPATPFVPHFITDAGVPLSGGSITAYVAGSTTPATVYLDADGTEAGTVVSLNARGEPTVAGNTVVIWLDDTVRYKFVLKDASSQSKWTIDDIADYQSQIDGESPAAFFISKGMRVVNTIAALKALDKTKFTRAFVTGYYSAGDGGGGAYWYDSTDTTSSDNGGTIIVAADGGRWKLHTTAPVSIKQFGAKGDLSQDDQPYIQAAVTWAAGRMLYAPAGQYRMNSGVTCTDQINLYGEGNGCGPGSAVIDNSNVTQFALYGDFVAFFSSSVYPSTYRDFQFNVAVANRPHGSSGCGIKFTPAGTATVANIKIENVGFNNLYRGIHFTRVAWALVQGCYFDDWVQDAIYSDTDMAIEASTGWIINNWFFGEADDAQRSCIHLLNGYAVIAQNEILGAQYGILVAPINFSAGFIKIVDNTIEENYYSGVRVESGGQSIAMVFIDHNEFSAISTGSTYIASVDVDDNSGTNYIYDVSITNNRTRNQSNASGKHIWVGAGHAVRVSDNICEELGANSPNGIQITGDSSNAGYGDAPLVKDNKFKGTFANRYVGNATTPPIILDPCGMTFASLPAQAANGSVIYVTDGTFANPVAGAGTGCIAKRLNGAWRGD